MFTPQKNNSEIIFFDEVFQANSRLQEALRLLDKAFKKAVEAVKEAKEELSRPLNNDEIFERDFTHLSDQKGPKEKKS